MKKSLLMACSAALALHAQVFQLGEVEIIANKDGSKSSDNNVAVITQEDMQRNEIKRLSEVAQMTPGVYVDKKARVPSKISTFAVLTRAEYRFLSMVSPFISRMMVT